MSKYNLLPCAHIEHISKRNCYFAHERLTIEEKMVRALIRRLKAEGYVPVSVYTDTHETVKNETQTMDAVFSVDESTITFSNVEDTARYGVKIILGNGVDCISDWNVSSYSDGWNDTIDDITMDLWEQYQ